MIPPTMWKGRSLLLLVGKEPGKLQWKAKGKGKGKGKRGGSSMHHCRCRRTVQLLLLMLVLVGKEQWKLQWEGKGTVETEVSN